MKSFTAIKLATVLSVIINTAQAACDDFWCQSMSTFTPTVIISTPTTHVTDYSSNSSKKKPTHDQITEAFYFRNYKIIKQQAATGHGNTLDQFCIMLINNVKAKPERLGEIKHTLKTNYSSYFPSTTPVPSGKHFELFKTLANNH